MSKPSNLRSHAIESLKRAFERFAAVKAKTRPYLGKRFGTDNFTELNVPDTYGLSEQKLEASEV